MPVKKISLERWREAQRWELGVWERASVKHGWRRLAWPIARPLFAALGSDRGRGEDWNHWWARQFDDYGFLPTELGDLIELGCGPYTNTRLIVRGRGVRRIVCSDPLARSYIHFKDAWLASAYRQGLILIDDHPIEECPYAAQTFDAVVLVNVLDHVYDADLCLRNAVGLVRTGGYLLVGQDLSDEEDEHLEHRIDDPAELEGFVVGHPIRLSMDDVEAHLREFDPILQKVLSREEGRGPESHHGTLVFAGKRRT